MGGVYTIARAVFNAVMERYLHNDLCEFQQLLPERRFKKGESPRFGLVAYEGPHKTTYGKSATFSFQFLEDHVAVHVTLWLGHREGLYADWAVLYADPDMMKTLFAVVDCQCEDYLSWPAVPQ